MRVFRLAPLFLAATLAACASAGPQPGPMHKVALHVDESDPARMNLALNNASNVIQAYQAKNEEVVVEVVAYGPGLDMLVVGSPVADRVRSLTENFPGAIAFDACGNTMAGVKKRTGKDVVLLAQAKVVPSGVVHLMERQEQGWSYVRP